MLEWLLWSAGGATEGRSCSRQPSEGRRAASASVFRISVALNLGVIRQTRSCMALVLVAAFLVGVFLFSHYPRWLGRVPRHVHAIALAVGVIAGSILWRAGALPVRLAARLAIFVIPVAAVHYFYFQT